MSDHSNEYLQPLRYGVVEIFRRLEKKDTESSISNVKSYGAGKALSLRGWKAKKVTELKSMLTRIGLHNLWFSELFIKPGKYV